MKKRNSTLLGVWGAAMLVSALYVAPLAVAQTYAPSRVTNNSGTTATGWDAQDRYWRDNFSSRAYLAPNTDYNAYQPAYRYGYETYNRNAGKPYDQVNQQDLQRGWDKARGDSTMTWSQAQDAARDSYDRMYNSNTLRTTPGVSTQTNPSTTGGPGSTSDTTSPSPTMGSAAGSGTSAGMGSGSDAPGTNGGSTGGGASGGGGAVGGGGSGR